LAVKSHNAVKEADRGDGYRQPRDIPTETHFRSLKDKAIVCNIGHFDDEIDMAWLNGNHGHTKDTVKPPQVDIYTIEGKR
jgi:adenosylhomocysteinase